MTKMRENAFGASKFPKKSWGRSPRPPTTAPLSTYPGSAPDHGYRGTMNICLFSQVRCPILTKEPLGNAFKLFYQIVFETKIDTISCAVPRPFKQLYTHFYDIITTH